MKGVGQASPGDEPCMQVGSCSGGCRSYPHSSPAVEPQLGYWKSWGGLFCPTAHVHFQHLKHEHGKRPISPDLAQALQPGTLPSLSSAGEGRRSTGE